MSSLNLRTFFLLLIICSPCLGASENPALEKKPLLPETVYFVIADEVYKIDYSGFLFTQQEFALSGGCRDVSIWMASFPDSGAQIPYEFPGGVPSENEIEILGASPADVVSRTGRDLDQGVRWDLVFITSECLSAEKGYRRVETAGEDQFELISGPGGMTSDASKIPNGFMYEMRMNNHTEYITPAVAFQAAALVASDAITVETQTSDSIQNLALHLSENGWYNRAIAANQFIHQKVFAHYKVPDLSGPENYTRAWSCWKPCFMCAGYAVGTLVGGTALAASCAVTFGATCVLGATGIVIVAMETITNCSYCLECRGGGGGGGGGEGGEGDECQDGYHECCSSMCCSDENPPAECP